MRSLLLPRVTGVRTESMIERLAVNILRMRRQMRADRGWQIEVSCIGHGQSPMRRSSVGSTDEVLFNVPDRVIGEVFVDLGDNPALHVVMKHVPQLRERARRRDNDDVLDFL